MITMRGFFLVVKMIFLICLVSFGLTGFFATLGYAFGCLVSGQEVHPLSGWFAFGCTWLFLLGGLTAKVFPKIK